MELGTLLLSREVNRPPTGKQGDQDPHLDLGGFEPFLLSPHSGSEQPSPLTPASVWFYFSNVCVCLFSFIDFLLFECRDLVSLVCQFWCDA